jgi:hypothetical protein
LILAPVLSEPQRGVGLIIAEFLVLGDADQWVGIDAKRGRDGGAKRLLKLMFNGIHRNYWRNLPRSRACYRREVATPTDSYRTWYQLRQQDD